MSTLQQYTRSIKSRGMVCLIGLFVSFALAPLSISHAATSKTRVTKLHVAKAPVGKSKKVIVQGKRRVAVVMTRNMCNPGH